tara:strand:+ start:176 stop:298 length:123 start_codon:yes stop_codon:yes gene_type:complete
MKFKDITKTEEFASVMAVLFTIAFMAVALLIINEVIEQSF